MPFDGTQLNRTAQLLLSAKARLEKDGWCQNQMHDATGAHCLWGAIEFKYQKDILKIDTILTRAISLSYPKKSNIPCWNDTPGRTKEEVLALLDKAVELAIQESRL